MQKFKDRKKFKQFKLRNLLMGCTITLTSNSMQEGSFATKNNVISTILNGITESWQTSNLIISLWGMFQTSTYPGEKTVYKEKKYKKYKEEVESYNKLQKSQKGDNKQMVLLKAEPFFEILKEEKPLIIQREKESENKQNNTNSMGSNIVCQSLLPNDTKPPSPFLGQCSQEISCMLEFLQGVKSFELAKNLPDQVSKLIVAHLEKVITSIKFCLIDPNNYVTDLFFTGSQKQNINAYTEYATIQFNELLAQIESVKNSTKYNTTNPLVSLIEQIEKKSKKNALLLFILALFLGRMQYTAYMITYPNALYYTTRRHEFFPTIEKINALYGKFLETIPKYPGWAAMTTEKKMMTILLQDPESPQSITNALYNATPESDILNMLALFANPSVCVPLIFPNYKNATQQFVIIVNGKLIDEIEKNLNNKEAWKKTLNDTGKKPFALYLLFRIIMSMALCALDEKYFPFLRESPFNHKMCEDFFHTLEEGVKKCNGTDALLKEIKNARMQNSQPDTFVAVAKMAENHNIDYKVTSSQKSTKVYFSNEGWSEKRLLTNLPSLAEFI